MKTKFPFLTSKKPKIFSICLLSLTLLSCTKPSATETVLAKRSSLDRKPTEVTKTSSPSPNSKDLPEPKENPNSDNKSSLWANDFTSNKWQEEWGVKKSGSWGLKNIEVMENPRSKFTKYLRVRYPEKSASPTVNRKEEAPLGGAQFFANLNMQPRDALRLSYYVRFSDNFDFVKGGKLPGLFGGNNNTGGKIPDGTDGFSTRYMWRRNGDGEVYAYLPTSKKHGTSLGRGNWQFQPGKWHFIEQELTLNQPGKNDGRIRVWFDGEQVLDEKELAFRTTKDLKIEGILFSTFFGGGDSSWASSKDVYADFANFSVTSVNQ
ncbi:polysaccharide lyase [Aerosakkonemataceae cyanobacterium BLCC-F154]|uniref:Polysaccharide lyase n=1 Tax=Floridaenema fluviatile BLCC-F154 TaxID=3153640 RepID=A0ABV4YL16_9CYAN